MWLSSPLHVQVLDVLGVLLDERLAFHDVLAHQDREQPVGRSRVLELDLEKARYHRVVLMADADVDGAHIRVLLLTFFFRNMRELIEAGYVYIAQPPLYLLKDGKQEHYFYNEREWEQFRSADGNGQKKLEPQRFKGLGEMDASQLWQTTMDPERRTLLRVTLDDAALADRLFTVLMGEDVPARKAFIEENAKDVRFLDI